MLALIYLVFQVCLELILVVGRVQSVVVLFLVLLFFNVVVQLLSHRVVKRELLVGTEDVADETKAEGKVATEALEGVGESFTG